MLGEQETLMKFASIIKDGSEFWKYAPKYHFVSGASAKPYSFVNQVLIGMRCLTNEGVFLTENQLIKRDMDTVDKEYAFCLYPNKIYEEKPIKDRTGTHYVEVHNEWSGFYVYKIRNEIAKHKLNSNEFNYLKHLNLLERLSEPLLYDYSSKYYLTKNIALAQLKSIYDYPCGDDCSDYWIVKPDEIKELTPEELIDCFNKAEAMVKKIVMGNRYLPKGCDSIYEFATGVRPDNYVEHGKEWVKV